MEYKLIDPVPGDAPALPEKRFVKIDDKWISYHIDHTWAYYNQTGAVRCHVTRYETETGKETPPLTLWDVDGSIKWRFKSLPAPLPLYNLHVIAHRPEAAVVVVEGEKCAELLSTAIPESNTKIVATCWIGGAKNVYKAEWEPLRGRTVILWPDHDKPGRDAMLQIAGILRGMDCKIRIVNIPDDKPDGWDVADGIINDGWQFPEIYRFISANMGEPPENLPEPPAAKPEPPSKPIDPVAASESIAPFQCLGYNHNEFYFLPDDTKQIYTITAQNLTNPSCLCAIGRASYWERMFFDGGKVNWKSAGETVRQVCVRQGVFDPSTVRGRGGWIHDTGNLVIHCGNKLIVDGAERQIHELRGRYRYEYAASLDDRIDLKPHDNHAACKLLEICEKITWDRDISGRLLAGWIVTAPICGCMPWRSHIWLTGPAGSGKSWVLNNIVIPTLGPWAKSVQSSTTEAGLRASLNRDALPVIFDEIEAEDQHAQSRVQNVLELARQASSDTGAKILKGSATQKVVEYQIRSQFLLSSVGVNIKLQADESRITVLEVRKPTEWTAEEDAAHFAQLCSMSAILTDEFCARIRARSFSLMSVIRDNCRIFSNAAQLVFKSRRAADQIGTLLAGAFALTSNKIADPAWAADWVAQRSWDEECGGIEQDSERCLRVILESVIPYAGKTISVETLLWNAVGYTESATLPNSITELTAVADALPLLRQIGITVRAPTADCRESLIMISESHSQLGKILAATPWSRSWGRTLKRLQGSVQVQAARFLDVKGEIRVPVMRNQRAVGLLRSVVLMKE